MAFVLFYVNMETRDIKIGAEYRMIYCQQIHQWAVLRIFPQELKKLRLDS